MIDIFDIMAFVVFAVLIATAFVIIVGLGMLPGWIAQKRGHPQAAAVNVASWLGLAIGGVLWPLALIWAFTKSSASAASTPADSQNHSAASPASANADIAQMQARVETLETRLRELQDRKEIGS